MLIQNKQTNARREAEAELKKSEDTVDHVSTARLTSTSSSSSPYSSQLPGDCALVLAAVVVFKRAVKSTIINQQKVNEATDLLM